MQQGQDDNDVGATQRRPTARVPNRRCEQRLDDEVVMIAVGLRLGTNFTLLAIAGVACGLILEYLTAFLSPAISPLRALLFKTYLFTFLPSLPSVCPVVCLQCCGAVTQLKMTTFGAKVHVNTRNFPTKFDSHTSNDRIHRNGKTYSGT